MSESMTAPPTSEPASLNLYEVDFLPAWYPQLRRRRQLLAAGVCALAAFAVALSMWGLSLRSQVALEQAALEALSRQQDHRLQEDEIVTKLGRHVEAARVLATLDRIMPPDSALTELSLETDPGLQDVFSLSNLSAWRQRPSNDERKLRAQLRGVAPSAVDGANLLAGLSKISFLRDVEMVSARDRANPARLKQEAGPKTINEFRVTFWIDLNPPANESAAGPTIAAKPAISGASARTD